MSHAVPVHGTVHALLLNHVDVVAALGDAAHAEPYRAPPAAPVLYLRPSGTWSAYGSTVRLPAGIDAIDVEATVGIVFDRVAARVEVTDALDHVRGLVVVADLAVPHASLYRPAIRERNRDGFCVFGAGVVPCAGLDLGALSVETFVDGAPAAKADVAGCVRGVAQAIADVSAFVRFEAGDVLLLGAIGVPVRATPGSDVRIEVDGVDAVAFTIDRWPEVATGAPSAVRVPAPSRAAARGPVRRGRVAWGGAIHDVIDDDGRLRLADGRVVDERDVVWLPPLAPVRRPRSIFALGLNYADHAKELAFKPPAEPLVFMKGESSLLGHRGTTRRPRDATYMHYECELAVVIGRTARGVRRDDAYDFVAGYTIANDYAIRDYLENWYRPNLKVKGRDGTTPIGPWLTDARAVPDPMALGLATKVDGRLTQQGTTRDMIFDVPFLIEWLSSFQALEPGDVILTGTPEGLVDTPVGAVLETAIEGLGVLVNVVVAE